MKKIVTVVSLAAFVIYALNSETVSAASATVALVPASGSTTNGSALHVSVVEDSGSEPVNAVQANVTYPVAYLQYVSTANTTGFSVIAQDSDNNGVIKIARSRPYLASRLW